MLIPKGVLALRKVAAVEKTRYAINGMLIERREDGTARATCTDGKVIASVTFPEMPASDWPAGTGLAVEAPKGSRLHAVLPLSALDAAEKAMMKKPRVDPQMQLAVDEESYRESSGETIRIGTVGENMTATVSTTKPVEGHFPPYEEVIGNPGHHGSVRIALNAEYLYRLATALLTAKASATGIGDPRSPIVVLEMKGPDSMVYVHTGDARFLGAIMPVAVEGAGRTGFDRAAVERFENAPPISLDPADHASKASTEPPAPLPPKRGRRKGAVANPVKTRARAKKVPATPAVETPAPQETRTEPKQDPIVLEIREPRTGIVETVTMHDACLNCDARPEDPRYPFCRACRADSCAPPSPSLETPAPVVSLEDVVRAWEGAA